ncbi:MAG: enoyl-CoA hydratase [Gammaproteobacteria bacterium]|jgi:2-(1,2-epoxy-1,2-dihydrophenyl)acetyl-CoA isomerase|nr:enoyl-CoA hydratase [Gammaproteobacteria bacterium]|tara:strand:+ start:11026 stop:11820 length:795 start_codon:yes stop_codon:yes gene_type:complete
MNYETIKLDVTDSVMTITMNRPERLNAWTYQMGDEMQQVITEGNANDEIEAFILTGEGRGFCAGADVKDLFQTQVESGDVRRGNSEPGNWVRLMRESKPMVGAVNGVAVGIGLTQILPMDHIVASRDAKFSCRFIKMGLVPELASSHYLVARCGFGQASDLMLSGKIISAAEAMDIRLIDTLVDGSDLLDTAHEKARSMGENPQAALNMVKTLITQNMAETNIDDVQARELAALAQCFESPEHKEAIQAFIEKREPDFRRARGK